MTRGASLTFDQVSKSYGAVMALQPTSMTVAPGEFFALLGTIGLGQVHFAGHHRGLRGAQRRPRPGGWRGHHRHVAASAEHRHGVPELRAVSLSHRGAEHRISAEDAAIAKGGNHPAGGAGAGDGAAGRVWAAHAGAIVRRDSNSASRWRARRSMIHRCC